MKNRTVKCSVLAICVMILSCESPEINPVEENENAFLHFSVNGQTLHTATHVTTRRIKLEVDHDVDVKTLVPEFDLPPGNTVFVNGVEQQSGVTQVDFTESVMYSITDESGATSSWEVTAVPLGCKILIDASHDGGVWWYPQYEGTGFNSDQYHQGQAFANALRTKGFEVTELGRGAELTEEMFFGYYIVIRVNGFQSYSDNELEVYTSLINRGMNLVFITDHKKYDPVDELGDHLGIQFRGTASGSVATFASHIITANMTSLNYVAGSVVTNATGNTNMEILGWLGSNSYGDINMNGVQDIDEPVAPPVMGILHYPHSRIFFIGDTNGIEVQPQPFVDNLITWMGSCNLW